MKNLTLEIACRNSTSNIATASENIESIAVSISGRVKHPVAVAVYGYTGIMGKVIKNKDIREVSGLLCQRRV